MRPVPTREIVGVDTETDEGDIFLIADSDGNRLESPGISFESVAHFLMRYEGKWVFFYNLGYDAECILKLLPDEILRSYRVKKRLEFEHEDFQIRYIDRKQLTIRKGKHVISCYDIAQYYDNKPLVAAYLETIKKPVTETYLSTKKKRQEFSLSYFLRHKKEIRDYCVQDCLLTKELAQNWVETFYKVFGFYSRNWISSGYLAERVLLYNNIPIPFFNEIDYEVQDLAWKSFYGGRFELIQKGFIGRCYLYDINSAYPYALTMLPDILNGYWIYSREISSDSSLGFFNIIAHIDERVKLAPFPFRTKQNRIIYPVGDFETYVTLDEIRASSSDPRIHIDVIESWQFIPNPHCTYPFKQFIEKLYYRRLDLKKVGNPLEKAIKIVLNSIYGKTAQRANGMIGNIFNPVIASFVTGFARAQLYRFMKENTHEDEVVAFATDSIALGREIPDLNSTHIGEMKLDKNAEDVIFLSNGFYRFNGKWKNRGVGKDRERKVEVEHLNTRIGDDGELYIAVRTTRTTHVKGGIMHNKLKNIGKIEEYEKKIGLNSDKKRFWLGDLCSLNDNSCVDSVPINANLVADIISKPDDMQWEDQSEETYNPESSFKRTL
jgi:hypothetical protein